ncbi:MAG: Gfo/Idh/MocA family oxidoreductase [Candidatus Rokubacteria bacterium]|nr:Gfo/Idh/MocA family oxidoreductase [Candidatus Rokubacteria bacterium]
MVSHALVVGYGSVGRRHTQVLAEIAPTLVIADTNATARARGAHDYPAATVIADLKDLDAGGFPWAASVAVIATWGPSHAAIFHALADRGVGRVMCEKPLAASVADANGIVDRSIREGIVLGVNHTLRYAGLADALARYASDTELGEPVAVVVDGGANCLLTNGLHWIDFACHMFRGSPTRVVSTARGEHGNPRSDDLHLYGGSAVWTFEGDREAIITFSNRSSIDSMTRVYYRNAVAETDLDLTTRIRRRDMRGVREAPAVTRTGPAVEELYRGRLPGVRALREALKPALLDVVAGRAPGCPASVGAAAVNACVGALIASTTGRAIDLPIDPVSEWGLKTWPIS